MGVCEEIVRADNVFDDKTPDDYKNLVVDFTVPDSPKIVYEIRFLRLAGVIQTSEPVEKDLEDFFREVCRPGELEEPNYQYMYIPEQPSQLRYQTDPTNPGPYEFT